MWQAGATLHRGARASHYRGLSRCEAQAPDAQAQQLWLTGPATPRHAGSSQTRARTRVPCTGRQTLNHCATREARLDTILLPRFYLYFLGIVNGLCWWQLLSCSFRSISLRGKPDTMLRGCSSSPVERYNCWGTDTSHKLASHVNEPSWKWILQLQSSLKIN